jgi:hypothetical protein
MKILRLKINSSVVLINAAYILVMLATAIVGWATDNQELLKATLSPGQFMVFSTIQSLVTIWLRTTNVQGNKPVEIVPKDTIDTSK